MIYSFRDPNGASLKKSPIYVTEQLSNFMEFSCLKIKNCLLLRGSGDLKECFYSKFKISFLNVMITINFHSINSVYEIAKPNLFPKLMDNFNAPQ